MISGYIDVNVIGQSIICGADGYVFKGEREKVMALAIETIKTGNFYLDSRLHQITNQQTLENVWKTKNRFWKKYNDNKKLSPREKTFLQLSATALNYTEIAELMLVEKRTIETMYARIAKKLNITSNKELALYALQNGLAIYADYSLIETALEEIG